MNGTDHLSDAGTLNTEEDARLFFQHVEAERRDCEEALMTAIAGLQKAHVGVQNAEDRLFQADMRVGRMRCVIRRSGFEEVLKPVVQKTQPRFVQVKGIFVSHLLGFPFLTCHLKMNISLLFLGGS